MNWDLGVIKEMSKGQIRITCSLKENFGKKVLSKICGILSKRLGIVELYNLSRRPLTKLMILEVRITIQDKELQVHQHFLC